MRRNTRTSQRPALIAALAVLTLAGGACTGQLPGSFKLKQQEEAFSSQLKINTKIDLLLVVDNSSSMDVSQEKLRKGFDGFARKYMQPSWDIRVAVITTDTYMAHTAFTAYLNSEVPGTKGWKSPYINSRLATFVNPPSNPSLVNLATGVFDNGVKFSDLIPAWGPLYARLLPGIHDGPISALCFEGMPYFLKGATHCDIRDNQNLYGGSEKCLNPDTSVGESSSAQCVNTVVNDSVHSGKAIVSTLLPEGNTEKSGWTNQLVKDFTVNVTTGSAGHGSERGLGSVLALLEENEKLPSAFFRSDSLRGMIFVSDEDDQTMEIPNGAGPTFSPWSYYKCDQSSLVAANGSSGITGLNGLCCGEVANNCRFGSEGTSCPSKTVDGYTYTVSFCPREDKLIPVTTVKGQLDEFFTELDSSQSTSANYFIATIVPLTGEAIQTLQANRSVDDVAVGAPKTAAVDRGDRYIELANLVGNGSLVMNIAEEDYSPILDAIGKTIIEKKSTFWLSRAATNEEEMLVKVIHADGSTEIVPSDKFVIEGKALIITDSEYVLSLAATDQIVINYQPKTLY